MATETITQERHDYAIELIAQTESLLSTLELELEDPRDVKDACFRQANVCRSARGLMDKVRNLIGSVPTSAGDRAEADTHASSSTPPDHRVYNRLNEAIAIADTLRLAAYEGNFCDGTIEEIGSLVWKILQETVSDFTEALESAKKGVS